MIGGRKRSQRHGVLLYAAALLACASCSVPTQSSQQGNDTHAPTAHPTTAAAAASLLATSQPQVIQPNYHQWLQVTRGMTEAEVNRLLGPPLSEQDTSGAPTWVTGYTATYGIIRFGGTHFDVPFIFSIIYDSQTKSVSQANDPFDGRLSLDGKPMVPALISPKPREEFSHYPRGDGRGS